MDWGLPLAAACLLAAASPTWAERAGDDRQSLEDLLLKARERRAQAQAQVRTQLDGLLAELSPSNRTPTPAEVASAVERIVKLGADATPLLVKRLDAPDGATEREKLVAREVATALSKMDTKPVTHELLALLSSAGNDGKRNVLRVLASTPEPERARPAVAGLFRSSTGELKHTCLRTLLGMGGAADDALLAEVLQGSDDTLIGLAIDALSAQRSAGAAEQVRRILLDARLAQRHAASLVDYFRTQPSLATPADVQAFVRLAASSSVAVDVRVHVLERLPALKPTLNVELKRLMEPLIGSPDRKLHEGALVFLSRLGDKAARKELLREYDELVSKNENWSESYVRRADMLAKLGDDDDAIKDYKHALVSSRNDPTVNPETWVKLARAYTRRGKFKDAAETLRKSPLADAALKALADDPEFVPLRDSKYGKEAFGLR
jgi:hypothetical protein